MGENPLTAIERVSKPEVSGEKCGVFAASFSDSFYQELYSAKNIFNYFKELVKKAFATKNFQDINSKPLVPVLLTLFRQAIWDPNFIEILVKEILESLNHRGPLQLINLMQRRLNSKKFSVNYVKLVMDLV